MMQRKPSPFSKRRRLVMALMPPPPSPSALSLVKELYNLAQEVGFYERPRMIQQRNQSNIVRRIKLLGPLFEEIKDCHPTLPPSAVLAFRELHLTIQRAKLLLDECREGSRLWLLMQTRRVSEQFYELTQEIASELSGLPLDLLEISVEVKEQVELLRLQSKRSTPIYEASDEKMRAEVLGMLSEVERKETPDELRVRSFFESLQIDICSELQRELYLLEEEMESLATGGDMAALISIKNLISFGRYCKCVLFGVCIEETLEVEATTVEASNDAAVQATGSDVPDEFKCPISLELMQDPVIISSGQTYDRVSIQRWIDSGHSTCPKSGQKLAHVNVIPNHALRSLIRQWCEDHKVPYNSHASGNKPTLSVDNLVTTRAALEATKLTAAFLVGKLASGPPEVQKQVAYELRLLAKCGTDNRVCIAEAGAIPFLVPLLSSRDAKTQENAITAILNLSICDANKKLIVSAGAVDPILAVLKSGSTVESRENAAATLFSLSVVDEYKVLIGSKSETFTSLIALLREGSSARGKRDAATALFNLAVYHGNKGRIIAAGAVPLLVELLTEDADITDDALAVLALLASSSEGLLALSGTGAIPLLVGLLRMGSSKGKENSTAVLLALCRSGSDTIVNQLLKISATVPALYNLITVGTPRAKRKASSLLRILHRSERSFSTALGGVTTVQLRH
ncbi:ubiquitin-protein ligase, PUB17 [Selaginella moellendorffii]|uniref:U-box domain-containing protein 12 n=1 Tax=Selaginella moellendorffii TaxID=88036 RepID=D8S2H5_SELML|nr:U-box domain-containing protein 1 [Selaginella moellendorffii]EFJ21632.1 ubiquitin-protein ligase, PUB17 [Selaginella moellendorffii]|eukprot:XP_002977628.1 U-box domain-containing protein 1 [Selaginella moellendorffii]